MSKILGARSASVGTGIEAAVAHPHPEIVR